MDKYDYRNPIVSIISQLVGEDITYAREEIGSWVRNCIGTDRVGVGKT